MPSLGGNLTDFFRVNAGRPDHRAGRHRGSELPLRQHQGQRDSGNNLANAVANGQIPLGNFAVNPLNGSQILIGSATGCALRDDHQGCPMAADRRADQLRQHPAHGHGLWGPDPNAPAGVGNLNNFIYVGTAGGPGSTSNTSQAAKSS